MVDWDLIKKLIKVVKEEAISGLAIEEKGVKYEVHREMSGAVASIATPVHTPAPVAPKSEDDDLVAITSPMVGTFYRAPSPESPAFAEIGQDLEVGHVICIIEAMKLFNEIEAEVRGKVVKILAENGKPVEYGQKLMLVKKA